MGPEDEFEVTPGRVFMVPLGADGQPHGEPQEMRTGVFDWGHEVDPGDSSGLDGGLLGGPEGALPGISSGSWSMSFELEAGENGEVLAALFMGKTVEEYRDHLRWVQENAWLEKLTGLNWGRFE